MNRPTPERIAMHNPDDNETEKARVFWIPEIGQNPIDLTEQLAEPMAMAPEPIPLGTGEEIEVVYFDELIAIEALQEGTLTPVYSDGELVGHAEVIHNEDGSRTLKVYGVNHNPEELP